MADAEDIPEQVYLDAARAHVEVLFSHRPLLADATLKQSKRLGFRAAVESAYRAGRTAASQAIRSHADQHFPLDGPSSDGQRTFRRHLLAAARIVDNLTTPAEVAGALNGGGYIACRAQDIDGIDEGNDRG